MIEMTSTGPTSDSRLILESLLLQQTAVTFRAGGPSMNPVIRDGNVVRVVPVTTANMDPGTILLYRHHGRLVLHRLIRRDKIANQYLMAADAATSGVETIGEAEIIGCLDWVQRGGKTIPLNTWHARQAGLTRYYMRPIRRWLIRAYGRIRKNNQST